MKKLFGFRALGKKFVSVFVIVTLFLCFGNTSVQASPPDQMSNTGVVIRWPSSASHYSNPSVSVIMLDYGWAQLEPREGVYDFTELQDKIARARQNNKRVALCIWDHAYDARMRGPGVPDWVECAKIVYKYPTGQQLVWPVYWDPVFREKWNNFIWYFSGEFADTFEFVMLTETTLPWRTELRPLWKAAGYDVEVYQQTIKDNILLFSQAFPNSAILQSINQFSGNSLSFFRKNPQDRALMWDLADYCYSLEVGLANPGLRAVDNAAQRLFVWPIFNAYAGLVPEALVMPADALNDNEASTLFDLVDKAFSIGSINYFIVPSFWLKKPDGPAMIDYANSFFPQ